MLLKLQQQFMHSIRTDNNDVSTAFASLPQFGISAEQRLNIFRNNYQISLSEALADIYPVLQQLIGEPAFFVLAQRYLLAHPSSSGNLHDLGHALASFIVDVEELQSLAYLSDVARLEWIIHQAYHAADHDGLDLLKLQNLNEADYGRLLFKSHPSVYLAAFDYAAVSIWNAHQLSSVTEPIDPAHAELAMVYRHQHEVSLSLLKPVEYSFLDSLCSNQSLAVAAQNAIKQDANFDLNNALLELVRTNVLVDVSLSRG